MIKHFIIMASAYKLGTRIVLDYSSKDNLDTDKIQKDIDYIKEKCGRDVPISTHFIQIEKEGWEEVGKYDMFFKDTKLIDNIEDYIEILNEDRILSGLDIADYILTKLPCTHLKLEKLVYMCYADYLCSEKEKLFNDKIYAFKLGPIIQSVYERYKKSGKDELKAEDDTYTYKEIKEKMPIKSRIISSKNGIRKMTSIDKTIEKYRNYTASSLVNLTHKENTPWSTTIISKEIKDDSILKYHKNETI